MCTRHNVVLLRFVHFGIPYSDSTDVYGQESQRTAYHLVIPGRSSRIGTGLLCK